MVCPWKPLYAARRCMRVRAMLLVGPDPSRPHPDTIPEPEPNPIIRKCTHDFGVRILGSRPFLIQSDSANRKRPCSTGLFFDWNLLVLLIVSRVDFIVFVLFLEAVSVREYCCTAVEIGWQLCASRFLREQRLDEPSSQRVGGFGLSRKPPQPRSWSCTQPRAAKATAGAAVVGSMGSTPRAAVVV